jgi:hypothetical protein
MRHWRKMTWAILAWTALIVIWMVAGGSSASSTASDCATDPSVTSGILTKQECIDASNVGTGLGVLFVGFIGFVGFVALALVWFMTKPKQVIVIQQSQ